MSDPVEDAFLAIRKMVGHYEKALKEIACISDGLEAQEIAKTALESGPIPAHLSPESQEMLRKELVDG